MLINSIWRDIFDDFYHVVWSHQLSCSSRVRTLNTNSGGRLRLNCWGGLWAWADWAASRSCVTSVGICSCWSTFIVFDRVKLVIRAEVLHIVRVDCSLVCVVLIVWRRLLNSLLRVILLLLDRQWSWLCQSLGRLCLWRRVEALVILNLSRSVGQSLLSSSCSSSCYLVLSMMIMIVMMAAWLCIQRADQSMTLVSLVYGPLLSLWWTATASWHSDSVLGTLLLVILILINLADRSMCRWTTLREILVFHRGFEHTLTPELRWVNIDQTEWSIALRYEFKHVLLRDSLKYLKNFSFVSQTYTYLNS